MLVTPYYQYAYSLSDDDVIINITQAKRASLYINICYGRC